MKKQCSKLYWWLRNHISAVAFFTGFVWDTLTLTRIDLVYENIVFISYLLVAFAGIVLVHSVETRRFAPRWLLNIRPWLPAVVQFPMGGLFSGFVIFYTKSASIFTSWPFLVVLLALFVGNEFFRKRYERLVFQLGMFYFALFSYLALVTPVFVRSIGTEIFVLAGLLSLFFIWLVVKLIEHLFPKLYEPGKKNIWIIIGAVYVSFNALYFTNTIPPVPLTLEDIGVFHNVVRTETGDYLTSYEKPAWYEGWRETSGVFHKPEGGAVYCFSSVFAPTRIRAPIFHSWQQKSAQGEWVRKSKVPFTIQGGREDGYRGYTVKYAVDEGEWRCVVETESRQVIGEVRFNVLDVAEPPTYVTDTR